MNCSTEISDRSEIEPYFLDSVGRCRMLADAEVQEYLDQIRQDVCSICVERPPGGPPCVPLGKNCGVELHLPQLIDAVREVKSGLLQPYLDHNRHQICEKCAFLHSSICPCPMDYLLSPIVDAVETVEERRRNRGEPPSSMTKSSSGQSADADFDAIRQAFQEGSGTWTGCDWPTRFGKGGLDLNGWSARQAEIMARETRGLPVGDDWQAAVEYLAQIERQAEQAENEAVAAVAAAERRDWPTAIDRARRAWLIEVGTGRLRWHGFPFSWQPLRQAVEAAAKAQDAVSAASESTGRVTLSLN
jgi:hypothetical protein